MRKRFDSMLSLLPPTILAVITITVLCIPSGRSLAAVLQLPADPPAQRTVDLVERWRVGGEDDEDVLLGLIQTGIIGPEGQVYLLDRQLSQVLVIDPEGNLAATLGRQGEGPGELNRPHGLFLLPDGLLAVIQGFPGRVTLLNPDGTPGGEIFIGGEANEGGFNFVRGAYFAQGKLVAQKGRGTFDMETQKSRNTTTLSVLDLDGRELVEIVRHEQENDLARRVFDEQANFSEMAQWTAGADGTVYTTPERDAYVINKRNLEGELLTTLRREFRLRNRGQQDKQEVTEGMVVVINGRRQEIDSKVLDHDPAIMGLHVAADGSLFVTNCFDQEKALPEGVAASYDVISPDGEFIEELDLRIPDFDPELDRMVFLDGRRFLHLKGVVSARDSMFAAFDDGEGSGAEGEGEEIEPLEVVLYELP